MEVECSGYRSDRIQAAEVGAASRVEGVGIVEGAEVGDRQPLRGPRLEHVERGAPEVQVDVGGRGRRHDRAVADAHARDIPGVHGRAGSVPVADVVLGVAGRVRDVPGPFPPARERLAAAQHEQSVLGHGDDLPPQALHVVAVEACRAGDEPGRVGEVARAALVDGDDQVRPAPHERPGRAGVVEVDVGEQDRPRDAAAERRDERRLARLRAGIDEDVADAVAADDVPAPQVQDVDLLVAGGRHRRATRMSGKAFVSSRWVQEPCLMPTVLKLFA